MAFCQNCGTQLADGAKFCENCGAPVEIPVQETPVETLTAEQPTAVVNTPEQQSTVNSAFVLSIIGLVLAEFGIPGIILSAIAKGKVKKAIELGATGGKLKAASILSKIGLVLSIVMTVFWVLYLCLIGGVVAYGISEGGFEAFESIYY